ncbi:MAG: hypothetical protein ACRDLK_06580 [Gaiellaceae bacterium]
MLADGTYDGSGAFSDSNDDHLYAEHLGGAVLHAGVVLGGNFGPGRALVRGLAFDISDPAKTFQGAAINVWGASGRDVSVLDVTVDGNSAIETGILARQVEGLVVARVVLRNFTDDGLTADENDRNAVVAKPMLIEDISVSGVSRPVPRSSNGTAEACIWLGNTATLRRASVSGCAWMGVWTGTAFHNGLVTDVTATNTPVGVYLEHFTTDSTFQHLQVGHGVKTGVNCEWADPAWGGVPACDGDTIQDSAFDTSDVGVYLDEGTKDTVVRRCSFTGQSFAAIGNYKGDGNSFSGNDYSGLGAGVPGVSTAHA